MTSLFAQEMCRMGVTLGLSASLLLACGNTDSRSIGEGAGGTGSGGSGSSGTSTGGVPGTGGAKSTGGADASGGALFGGSPFSNITVTYGGQSTANVEGRAHGGTSQSYDAPLTPPETCDDFVSVDDQPYCGLDRLCNAQAIAAICSDAPVNVAREVDDCLYDNGPYCVSIWDPNAASVCLATIVTAEKGKDTDFDVFSAKTVALCPDQADWFFLGMNVIWAMLPAGKRDALEACVTSAADCKTAYGCLSVPGVDYYNGPACAK